MNTITTEAAVDQLRSVFAIHELPEAIVSGNGATLTCAEFGEFIQLNGMECNIV